MQHPSISMIIAQLAIPDRYYDTPKLYYNIEGKLIE